MIRRRALFLGVVLGLFAAGLPLAAQTMIFKWIDRKGTLHLTDRLADVPEPYYSMYRARLREIEEQKTKAGQAGAAPTSSPGSEGRVLRMEMT